MVSKSRPRGVCHPINILHNSLQNDGVEPARGRWRDEDKHRPIVTGD